MILGVKQIANVAALPGIVGRSVGLPDIHSGYGFAIGNMAAFDMSDPKAVVSPGESHESCQELLWSKVFISFLAVKPFPSKVIK